MSEVTILYGDIESVCQFDVTLCSGTILSLPLGIKESMAVGFETPHLFVGENAKRLSFVALVVCAYVSAALFTPIRETASVGPAVDQSVADEAHSSAAEIANFRILVDHFV